LSVSHLDENFQSPPPAQEPIYTISTGLEVAEKDVDSMTNDVVVDETSTAEMEASEQEASPTRQHADSQPITSYPPVELTNGHTSETAQDLEGGVHSPHAQSHSSNQQRSISEESGFEGETYVNGISSMSTTPAQNGVPDDQHQPQAGRGPLFSGLSNIHVRATSTATSNGYYLPPAMATSNPEPFQRSFSAVPSLLDYLLHLNATKEGVNVLIQVNPISGQPFVSYAHSFLLYRSFRLRRLLARQHQAHANENITLYPARYIIPHAFEAALRYLYSDGVLGKEFFTQTHPETSSPKTRIHNLDYLLSYWISAIELGLDPVYAHAENLFREYLSWDVLEIAYKVSLTPTMLKSVKCHGFRSLSVLRNLQSLVNLYRAILTCCHSTLSSLQSRLLVFRPRASSALTISWLAAQ
jgi:hypothetical protein